MAGVEDGGRWCCCRLMIMPLCVRSTSGHYMTRRSESLRTPRQDANYIPFRFWTSAHNMQYSQTRLCLVAETDLNTTGIGVATILSVLATAKNHRFPSYPLLIHQTPNFALSPEPNITRTIFSRLSRHHDSVGCRESLQDAKAVDEAVPGRPTRESNRFCRRRCPEEYSTDRDRR